MTSVDLLIFDLDGTLVDSQQDLTNAVNFARKELGYPELDVATVTRYVGDGVHKLLERSIPDAEAVERALALFRDHYSRHALDFTRPYPGVHEMLHHFRNKKMAVLSNKPAGFTRSILEGLNLAPFFEMILGGDSADALKPDPAPVLHILKQMKVDAGRAVMIGDGPTDIQAAKNAGILSCAVTYGLRDRKTLAAEEPDFIIDQVSELCPLFV
ncbi:MAG: HAD family hydrolase [Calditrichaeota bacterium]|nr:MAG: HAD family hydrolase [Calditrichota bacterium]